MKFASYGRKELAAAWCLGLALVIAGMLVAYLADMGGGVCIVVVSMLAWLSFILFFRDPERKAPADPDAVLSPADGVVKDIELVAGADENKYFNGENAVRIGIFLSVFDVHINRAPCKLKVVEKLYRKGAYHDARNPQASAENEAATIVCEADIDGYSCPVIVRQISGAVARRIVCDAEAGIELAKAQRYGMIKFGSRTELFLPAGKEFEISVKIGDKVHAGTTVIARLRERAE
jgi:phosphatidylserine decarboxylase